MTDYSIFHQEQFGHGRPELNTLSENKKVIIRDHDGFYDVYECDSDDKARKIANWYISSVYESYPEEVELVEQDVRRFSVELKEIKK